MKYTIKQEDICARCERDSSRCEGSGCESATADYMDDHGLEEVEGNTFSEIEINSSVFIVNGTCLHEEKVKAKLIAEGTVNLQTNGITDQSYTVDPNAKEYNLDCSDIFVFMSKQNALRKYKEVMAEQIVHMAETIAKFS